MGAYKLDSDLFGTLLEFPSSKNSTNSTAITPELLSEFLSNSADDEEIKSILETYFFERLVNMNNILLESSPFDAIFISDLEPDTLNALNVDLLNQLKVTITDLSDTISFNDGLDD